MTGTGMWGHSIAAAAPGHTCVRNRCRRPAAFLARHQYRVQTSGATGRSARYLCVEHGRAWAARHNLTLPEQQAAPAVSSAGAVPNNPIKEL